MVTISLCMIVKNEEAVLARCLDTVADLVDEIIIVDTGSTDRTKEIATLYTDKLYDFEWVDDFSKARNFAFSKATKEYIYSADADEVLDKENRERFRVLKECLLSEIEIVQMKYGNQLSFGTVYNFDEEYRPKLFKRLRSFVWEEAIHETVRLQPVIYDSDIVITHMPTSSHGDRDLRNFEKQIAAGSKLSKRLQNMYARELLLVGTDENLFRAEEYFAQIIGQEEMDADMFLEACCILTRVARLRKDNVAFFKYAMKAVASESCSEICVELGRFYETLGDLEEAVIWYYNAAYSVQPVLVKASGEKEPIEGLLRCYQMLGLQEQEEFYQNELIRLIAGGAV
ncbi:MAG: glycosyltransferase family 2 protein [Lachnospiraceae bacterium]|nr:glycosyltransferase family 2 protein [Lachnospiraceae bacterium]